MNDSGILCSIVMPVYNVEKSISRMLDSIIAQTYKNWELIVVNDGSTDNTEEVIRKYSEADKRIRCYTQINSKVGTARATGISLASGKYLFQMDGDDKLSPYYIENLLTAIENSGCDLVWCNCHTNDNEEGIWNLNFRESTEEMIKAILARKQFYALWVCVFKTDIAKECANEMRTMSLFEDWAFLIAYLLRCNSIKHITDALYFYNISNNNSVTHTNAVNHLPDYIKALSSIHKSLEHSGRLNEFEYELNYIKLFVVRDFIDDLRYRDYDKFISTYPDAIDHIWDYTDYPTRLKISAWLIKKRLSFFVPVVCKFDALLIRLGLSKQI